MVWAVSPLCPRCGYDLSGTVATFNDRCPRDGVCTECGLHFEWGRVLALAEHPWLFEYHWRRQPLRRLTRTWLEAMRPRRFWRAVRLTDPIHLWPLALVVLGLVVSSLAAFYTMDLANCYRWFSGPSRFIPGRQWQDFLAYGGGDLLSQIAGVPGLLVAFVATPLVFVLLPQTLGQARVRPAHIVRMWLYSLWMPLAVLGLWAALRALLFWMGWEAVAWSFNPWMWAGRPWGGQHADLFWLAGILPGLGLALLYAGWGAYWSWCGCRLYLRLEQPGRVVGALTAVVVLAAICAEVWAWVMGTS